MLPSPSSSPQHVFETITNRLPRKPLRQPSLKFFPTPPKDQKPKRQALLTELGPNKRIKLSKEPLSDSDDYDSSSSEEEDSDDDVSPLAGLSTRPAPLPAQRVVARVGQHHDKPASHFSPSFGQPSTRPILRSFVSSHKADVFRCASIRPFQDFATPYACAFSHSAKAGTSSHLAVASEEGAVHIFDTTKRRDWDPEPSRHTLQPHQNAAYEVKWDNADTRIVTCSGDKTTRITDVRTGTVTHLFEGDTNTMKCVAWDPNHQDLLATGSRDGTICLWDLRTSNAHEEVDDLNITKACRVIPLAHEDPLSKAKGRARKTSPPGITGLLFPGDSLTRGLVSSGSADGILKSWDLRYLESSKKSRSTKPQPLPILATSAMDPTTFQGSRRPRGICSLALGQGLTAGYIFGLGADSNVHCYSLSDLTPQLSRQYSHPSLKVNFYVTMSVSPCGKWLATGGSSPESSQNPQGRAFLFDVAATRPSGNPLSSGVELKGQIGEIGAVDWGRDALATCADDGTVRVWRPDLDVHRECIGHPEDKRWEWAWAS